MKYEIIESPTNGTTGQFVGTFEYADLPARFKAAIAANEAGKWEFPALSDGDSGDALPDLNVIVRSIAESTSQPKTINETNKTITITSAPSVYGRDEQTYWVIRKTSAPEYFSHIVGATTYAHPFERATQFGTEAEADDFRRQKLGWMWEVIKVVRTATSYDDEPVLPCEA